jgi:hypothetical protein
MSLVKFCAIGDGDTCCLNLHFTLRTVTYQRLFHESVSLGITWIW